MSAATPQTDTTVKGFFNSLCETYINEVLKGELGRTASSLQSLLHRLLLQFEDLWRRLGAVGAFSDNDELADYSTTALEMLWTPYVIADLYQRLQMGPGAMQTAGAAVSQATARMPGDGPRAQTATVCTYRARTEENLQTLSRQEVLASSHAWFNIFFEWLNNTTIVSEDNVKRYTSIGPDQRSIRIELAKIRADLQQQWTEAEAGVKYLLAKRRRMMELMDEDGESMEEMGGEEEEALRRRAIVRLKWSAYDAFHQMNLSTRELQMLESVQPEQRATISSQYQQTLDAVRRGELTLGRQTYTILSDGGMVVGTPDRPVPLMAQQLQSSGGLSAPSVSLVTDQLAFRQRIRDELMIDRNPCTMTLEAFAQKEMAEVQRQMEQAAEMQVLQKEEDERLGEDGVEERQRKKDSEWDDWKDNHPANGPTNKGNYS